MNNYKIQLKEVSVEYRIPTEKIGTFKEYMIRLVQGKIKHRSFFALKNINMEISKGGSFWCYWAQWCREKYIT